MSIFNQLSPQIALLTNKARQLLKLDEAVIYALLGNLVSLIVGPITAYLITIYFSVELQGYYYTFGSLQSLLFLGEVGLSQAIIQFASHEWSQLNFDEEGRIEGEPNALSRFASLVRLAMLWYSLASLVSIPILIGIGLQLFSSSADSDIVWRGPWIILCILSGINFVFIPIYALLQGCGEINRFWFYRLIQQLLNGLTLWFTIFGGLKLWATVIAMSMTFVWNSAYLLWHYRNFIASLIQLKPGQSRINWWGDLWPVQWKIAIAWLGATFTSQMMIPLVFRFDNPTEAGKIGLTITLSMVVYGISTNWIVTKAPQLGTLIAERNFAESDKLFFESYRVSLAASALLVVIVSLLIFGLNYFNIPLAERILPTLPSAILLSASIFTSATTGIAIYLRAHKKEPLAMVYLISSTIILVGVIPISSTWGSFGVTIWYLAIVSSIQLPWAIKVFREKKSLWHQPYPIIN